jgi:hypothetical protein
LEAGEFGSNGANGRGNGPPGTAPVPGLLRLGAVERGVRDLERDGHSRVEVPEDDDQEPQAVRPEELAAAARLIREHADHPDSHVCRICGVSRCQTWRNADAVVLRGLMQRSGVQPSEADQDSEGR